MERQNYERIFGQFIINQDEKNHEKDIFYEGEVTFYRLVHSKELIGLFVC